MLKIQPHSQPPQDDLLFPAEFFQVQSPACLYHLSTRGSCQYLLLQELLNWLLYYFWPAQEPWFSSSSQYPPCMLHKGYSGVLVFSDELIKFLLCNRLWDSPAFAFA